MNCLSLSPKPKRLIGWRLIPWDQTSTHFFIKNRTVPLFLPEFVIEAAKREEELARKKPCKELLTKAEIEVYFHCKNN